MCQSGELHELVAINHAEEEEETTSFELEENNVVTSEIVFTLRNGKKRL